MASLVKAACLSSAAWSGIPTGGPGHREPPTRPTSDVRRLAWFPLSHFQEGEEGWEEGEDKEERRQERRERRRRRRTRRESRDGRVEGQLVDGRRSDTTEQHQISGHLTLAPQKDQDLPPPLDLGELCESSGAAL